MANVEASAVAPLEATTVAPIEAIAGGSDPTRPQGLVPPNLYFQDSESDGEEDFTIPFTTDEESMYFPHSSLIDDGPLQPISANHPALTDAETIAVATLGATVVAYVEDSVGGSNLSSDEAPVAKKPSKRGGMMDYFNILPVGTSLPAIRPPPKKKSKPATMPDFFSPRTPGPLPPLQPVSSATNTTATPSSSNIGSTQTDRAFTSVSSPVEKGPGKKLAYRHALVDNYDLIEPMDEANETCLQSRADLDQIAAHMRCGRDGCENHLDYVFVGNGPGRYVKWLCSDRSCNYGFDSRSTRINVSIPVERVAVPELQEEIPGLPVDEVEGEVLQQIQRIYYNDFAATYMSQRNDSGYNGYARLFAGLHLQPVSGPTYYHYCKLVYAKHHEHFSSMIEVSLERVKRFYMDVLHIQPDENGLIPIMVSFDTTFPRRGYKSLFATGYIVEAFTGMVIDKAIIAKCRVCASSEYRQIGNCPHRDQHHGSSGDMEALLAIKLFEASRGLGFMYKVLICDGDSKAYSHIKNFYGPGTVDKEFCGNHVSKIAGNQFRKMRTNSYQWVYCRASKKLVKRYLFTGKKGVTDKFINKLSTLYQNIVKDTTLSTVEKQDRVLALLSHNTDSPFSGLSLDDHHSKCGIMCEYKRALVDRTAPPARTARPFAKYRKNPMAMDLIKKVFEHLARAELLSHCSRGLTQNINESIHSKQHVMSDKCKWHSEETLLFVMEVTILQHNFGHEKACLLHYLTNGTSQTLVKVLRTEDEESSRVARRPPVAARRAARGAGYGAGRHDRV